MCFSIFCHKSYVELKRFSFSVLGQTTFHMRVFRAQFNLLLHFSLHWNEDNAEFETFWTECFPSLSRFIFIEKIYNLRLVNNVHIFFIGITLYKNRNWKWHAEFLSFMDCAFLSVQQFPGKSWQRFQNSLKFTKKTEVFNGFFNETI